MSKTLELAKKLKALADKGIGGEKENAVMMLERLMKKHGFTMEDIEGVQILRHRFQVSKDQEKFFTQIVSNVIGKRLNIWANPKDRKKVQSWGVECTAAEAVEIQAKFDFYFKAWEDDLKVFYSAFIQKNHLYKKPEEDGDEDERPPLSPEEKAKYWKMAQMMNGLDKHQFHKQLKSIS